MRHTILRQERAASPSYISSHTQPCETALAHQRFVIWTFSSSILAETAALVAWAPVVKNASQSLEQQVETVREDLPSR